MLRVILYKNCILNNKYQEVMFLKQFDTAPATSLSLYLQSLENVVIDLQNVYYENTGELVIDRDLIFNPYDYNYAQFIEYDGTTETLRRYCFVNSISCKNGCVYLKYEEDIWSSYGSKIIGCQKSFLEKSRLAHYNEENFAIKELPLEYDGNNNLNITPLRGGQPSHLVYCLMQIQLYQLVQGTSDLQISYNKFIFATYNNTVGISDTVPIQTSLVQLLIQNMVSGQLKYRVNNVEQLFNYKIGNVYFIPAQDMTVLGNISFDYNYADGDVRIYYVENSNAIARGFRDKAYQISNNYKNLFVGTYNENVKLKNNGTSIPVETYIYMNGINFTWQLRIANEILDITDSFKFELPATSILAEDFAQRKIALNLEEYKLSMTRGKEISSNTIGDILDFRTGLSNIILGAFTGKYAGLMNQGRNMEKSYENILNRYSFTIPTLNKMIESIRAPKYSNIKGNIGTSNNTPNYDGLILVQINPDNAYYVKETVDIMGYNVYEYIGDNENYSINDILFDKNNFDELSATYDFVKFSSINVYGKFTNEIAEKLNSILENGVRIWYSPYFDADTYTDSLLN